MITDIQIRKQVADYVARKVSFTQFQNWLVSHSLNMDQDSEASLQELVCDLNESIYTYVDGHITQGQLIDRLAPYAQQYQARIRFAEPAPIRTADRLQLVMDSSFQKSAAHAETQDERVDFG